MNPFPAAAVVSRFSHYHPGVRAGASPRPGDLDPVGW